MADWHWYISIAAVRQFMDIAGLTGELEDDNPQFVRAQEELGAYSRVARPVEGKESESGALYYRHTATIRGRSVRLEFTVVPTASLEGRLPQLVRVTAKQRGGTKHR